MKTTQDLLTELSQLDQQDDIVLSHEIAELSLLLRCAGAKYPSKGLLLKVNSLKEYVTSIEEGADE